MRRKKIGGKSGPSLAGKADPAASAASRLLEDRSDRHLEQLRVLIPQIISLAWPRLCLLDLFQQWEDRVLPTCRECLLGDLLTFGAVGD